MQVKSSTEKGWSGFQAYMGVTKPDSEEEEEEEEREEQKRAGKRQPEKGREQSYENEEQDNHPEDIDDLLGLRGGETDFRPQKKREEVTTGTLISFDDDSPVSNSNDTSDMVSSQPSSVSKTKSSPRADRTKTKARSQGYGSMGYGSTSYGSIGYGSIGGTSSAAKESKKKSSSSGLDNWDTNDWGEGWSSSGGGGAKTSGASDGWDNEEWSTDGWGNSSGWSDVDLRTKSD